jgi:hypothetical protein
MGIRHDDTSHAYLGAADNMLHCRTRFLTDLHPTVMAAYCSTCVEINVVGEENYLGVLVSIDLFQHQRHKIYTSVFVVRLAVV